MAQLEPEQLDLLCWMVERERDVPRDRRFWLLIETVSGSTLQGGAGQGGAEVAAQDVKELAYAGLLRRDGKTYYVRTEGRNACAEWLLSKGAPLERVESEVRRLLDTDALQADYGKAYELWAEAESLLWREDSTAELTTLGHKAREAMQEFATAMVARSQPPDVDPDPAHVKRRLGAVIALLIPEIGVAHGDLLKALGRYAEATMDLIQRQVHGGQKEGMAACME